MMRLWKATVEVEVLIASEAEPSDRTIISAAKDEIADNSLSCAESYPAQEIICFNEIPKDWRDSIPRGDVDDLTCEQIVEAVIEANKQAAYQRPMPNQTSLPLAD